MRLARADDLDEMLALRDRAVRAVDHPRYPVRQLAAWAGWPMADLVSAVIRGMDVHVACRDGRIAGFAWATCGTRPHLLSAYVDPGDAGQGVGSALLAHVERTLQHRGARRLFVAATHNAVAFYRRRGFECECEFDLRLEDAHGPLALPLCKMVKALD